MDVEEIHLETLLFASMVLLLVAILAVSISHRIGLGSILGFIAAGVILGPSVAATPTLVEELREISELGVVLLLFVIGLEMRPRKLWSMRRLVFGLGSLQVLVTGAAITSYVLWQGLDWRAAVIIGFGLSLSSTAFVLQILTERGDMATEHGRSTFSVLLLQDIAIVPLLALVPLLTEGTAEAPEEPLWQTLLVFVGMFVALYLAGRYAIPFLLAKLAKERNMQAFTMLIALAVLGAATAMDLIGASEALGAFLMGMLLSASVFRHQIEAIVEPFKGLLLSLFFISVGMSVQLDLLFDRFAVLAMHVGAVFVIKIVVLLGLCYAFGLSRPAGIRTAFLLPQCGEFGFVLFGAAVAVGLLSDTTFALAILFVSITMIFTPLLVKVGDWLAVRTQPAREPAATEEGPAQDLARHVVVAGYGRVGRTLCHMLEKLGVPYVAFDSKHDRVSLGRREGRAVYYGDISNPRIAALAGVGRAAAIAITLDRIEATKRLVILLKNMHGDVPIYARAHNVATRNDLLECGVSEAVPDVTEGTLQLGSKLLLGLGIVEDDLNDLLADVRRDGYSALRLGQQEA